MLFFNTCSAITSNLSPYFSCLLNSVPFKIFGKVLLCLVNNRHNYYVHAGIGQVQNLRVNSPSFTAIMWDPPPTTDVHSDLTYHLTVTNMNTGVVIINTIATNNNYPVLLQHCTSYNFSVTPISLGHSGDAKFVVEKVPGSKWRVNNKILLVSECFFFNRLL